MQRMMIVRGMPAKYMIRTLGHDGQRYAADRYATTRGNAGLQALAALGAGVARVEIVRLASMRIVHSVSA